MAFALYKDSGLTEIFNPAIDRIGPVKTPPEYHVLYLGSPTEGETLQAASAPGTDQITASIVDASPGSGLEASDIKLAASADTAVIDLATAGDPANLGTTISGGVANAVPIGMRIAFAAGGAVYDTNVSIQISAAVES